MILPLLLACTAETETEDPAAHACEHVGASEGTLAAGSALGEGDTLPMDGEPYTVTLVEGAAGYINVDITGDTAALLFLGTADVAADLYFGDEAVGLPDAAPNELCAEDIPEHYDIDFHEAGTWSIVLGPAAVTEVWVSLASAEGHAHE